MRGAIRQAMSGNQWQMRATIEAQQAPSRAPPPRHVPNRDESCPPESARDGAVPRQRPHARAPREPLAHRPPPDEGCNHGYLGHLMRDAIMASRAVGASTVTTTAPSPPQASVKAAIAASPWAIAACTRATRSRGEEGLRRLNHKGHIQDEIWAQSRGDEGLRRCNLGAISHLLALEAISADVPGGERRRNVPQPEGRAAHHGAADRLHRLVEGGKHPSELP